MEGKSTSDGSENDMASTSILKTRQAKQALRVTIQKALRQVSGQSVEHQCVWSSLRWIPNVED